MASFTNEQGISLVKSAIGIIKQNKQYLSDIDGKIGDGDHGINMNKGFTLCEQELEKNPGNLTTSLQTLSKILMMNIGGSMGPLYGMMFRAMAGASTGHTNIDASVFADMLTGSIKSLSTISKAQVGDKTLMDTLIPAEKAYRKAIKNKQTFAEALESMVSAAEKGKNSTENMVAKIGRSSRLGERSRGVLDAGAVSCFLILSAFAGAAKALLREKSG